MRLHPVAVRFDFCCVFMWQRAKYPAADWRAVAIARALYSRWQPAFQSFFSMAYRTAIG
jgi:hypothetical protein